MVHQVEVTTRESSESERPGGFVSPIGDVEVGNEIIIVTVKRDDRAVQQGPGVIDVQLRCTVISSEGRKHELNDLGIVEEP